MIAAPTVSHWIGGMLVGWPGGNADHVEVHVADLADFEPSEGTCCGILWGPGEWSVVDMKCGHTYYARLVAFNVDGDLFGVSPASRGIEPMFLVSRS